MFGLVGLWDNWDVCIQVPVLLFKQQEMFTFPLSIKKVDNKAVLKKVLVYHSFSDHPVVVFRFNIRIKNVYENQCQTPHVDMLVEPIGFWIFIHIRFQINMKLTFLIGFLTTIQIDQNRFALIKADIW